METWPYVTARLEVRFLPDSATGAAPAILTTGNKPAYRLTPETYFALADAAERLEGKLRRETPAAWEKARAGLENAAAVLIALWEWLVSKSPTGSVATVEG